MNCLTIFCFVIIATYVFCSPVDDGWFRYCHRLRDVRSILINRIPDELEIYICYDEPPYYNIDYNVLYTNVNAAVEVDDDNEEVQDKWINCLWFGKAQFKVVFLHNEKLAAYVKNDEIRNDGEWHVVDFDFVDARDANRIYDLTEIRDNQQVLNEYDPITLQQLLVNQRGSYELDLVSNSAKIYSESFDPEPSNFDNEYITIVIIRSPANDVTHFVLTKSDFWVSKVDGNYITLFIDSNGYWPYVITFDDNSTAKEYRNIMIKLAKRFKENEPFPSYIRALLP